MALHGLRRLGSGMNTVHAVIDSERDMSTMHVRIEHQ